MIFFCILFFSSTILPPLDIQDTRHFPLLLSQFNSIIHIKPFACTWMDDTHTHTHAHTAFCSIYYFTLTFIHKMCLLLLLYVKKIRGEKGVYFIDFCFLDVVDHPVLNCLWKTFYTLYSTRPYSVYRHFLVVLYFNIYSLHLFAFTAFSHTYIHTLKWTSSSSSSWMENVIDENFCSVCSFLW